ncbi:MAG: ATP-dependent DNA ligase [Actinomycetota bacterium]|nr:ATP-dependent DNA ligase [Actinomycetota bacterium]
MLLAALVSTSQEVAATRARSGKIDGVAGLLGRLQPEEIPVAVAFLSGEPRQGKIGVGYATVYGVEQPPAANPTLTLGEVDAVLARIVTTTGPGSQPARRRLLVELMGRATGTEQDFLRRLLIGELRQGALRGIMAEAIARAAQVSSSQVRRALMVRADLGAVALSAISEGSPGLERFGLQVLSPIQPMLAQTASTIAAALGAVGEAVVEWKLDGARIQAHRAGSQVRLYTRNLNDVTDRLPELGEAVRRLPPGRLVLDGEALALGSQGSPHAFHETMSRFGTDERPTGALALVPFFFDLLHLEGRDLIDHPLRERLALLDEIVPSPSRVPRLTTSDPEGAERFLEEARSFGHEGVMVKALASRYEAGRRGASWLKVKPAHTLDLVVLAAEWGHGRRTGWLSNLHLGARDPAGEGFVMLGKTFKGMTDEMLAWQTVKLLELEERRTRSTVFVRPELVVEVAFDGVLPSPRYPGGVALRFARVKGYRPDKSAAEADTIGTLLALAGMPEG